MKFTKMHGCGNDYIYINGMEEIVPADEKPELVRKMSDRHFGIGSDGVIFICPSEQADFEMEMWNADGTRGEMCGNGIRCVAKYVYDNKLIDKKQISIISAGKVKYLDLTVEEEKVKTVRVNMGSPILTPGEIPVNLEGDCIINHPIIVNGETYGITCVSMGNPHGVVFLPQVNTLELDKIGPFFENHVLFPNRTNTEFVKVIDENTVEMRVWERGSGETLACGTGCCATLVACVLNGLTKENITVKLLGGQLQIYWDREQNVVYMTGPAETVFEGRW